eukprot:1976548-Prymnesium_polylepis.2
MVGCVLIVLCPARWVRSGLGMRAGVTTRVEATRGEGSSSELWWRGRRASGGTVPVEMGAVDTDDAEGASEPMSASCPSSAS